MTTLTVFALTAPALADVTFTGSVDPETPPANDNLNADLEIGDDSSTDNDPRATVRVDGGAQFTVNRVYVGSDEFFFGRMLVSGAGTKVTVDSANATDGPALQVGRSGNGYLEVSDGAWLELTQQDAVFAIGDNATAVGEALVTGDFSLVTLEDDLIVGDAGFGRLRIADGALFRIGEAPDQGTNDLVIGATSNGTGEVFVEGYGSRLVVGDDATIGVAGHGLLAISDGAIVDADTGDDVPVMTVGAKGRVLLDGGTLAIDRLNLDGVLGGAGLVTGDAGGSGTTAVGVGGRIEVGADELLRFDDDVTNQGSVTIDGGELRLVGGFTNNAVGSSASPGRITVDGGVVQFTEGLTNGGVIAITEGSSDLFGAITNEAGAAITIARDAVATFYDPFTDNGGTLTLLAGANALFLSDLTFQAASTLSLTLEEGAETALSVAGEADVSGASLRVILPSDFDADAGDTFTLLEADSINGTFIPPVLPSLEGGESLSVVQTASAILLQVSGPVGLDGDFNEDGVVDGADYTAWRDGLPGGSTPQQYSTWVANFGATAALAAGGSGQAIPEPTAAALVLMAGLAFVRRR